jgi:hypothetical protein
MTTTDTTDDDSWSICAFLQYCSETGCLSDDCVILNQTGHPSLKRSLLIGLKLLFSRGRLTLIGFDNAYCCLDFLVD